MREFCFKNKVQIDFVESSLKDWFEYLDKLNNLPELIEKKSQKLSLKEPPIKYKIKETITIPPLPLKSNKAEKVPRSYEELNILIDLCGEGISKTYVKQEISKKTKV